MCTALGWPSQTRLKLVWPTFEAVAWAFFVFGWLEWSKVLPDIVSRILCGLGTISYSIYMLHFAVIHVVAGHQITFQLGGPVTTAFATVAVMVVPATILLSVLTFRLIEEPFLQLRVSYQSEKRDPHPVIKVAAVQEAAVDSVIR